MEEYLPYDIIFLKSRLETLVENEEYEKAAIVKKWIDDLIIFYNINEKILK